MSGQFALDVAAFAKKAQDQADLITRKIVLDVGARLVQRSPVDTGRFRSNWYYGSGAVDETTSEQTNVTIVNGIGNIPVKAASQVHYITNNLPYAWALERGHSKQAPLGMVGLTVLEFRQIVAAAAGEGDDGISVLGTP